MSLFSLPFRYVLLLLFIVCAGLLGFGLYLQHGLGLEPCPMCIMQRYIFVLIGICALIGGLHAPKRLGGRIYSTLLLLLSLSGASIAARQSWLQLLPPADVFDCGPGLAYMLDSFGIAKALPMIFAGSGDCSAVEWTFLGLSIANWSLLCFSAVTILSIALLWVLRSARN